MSYTIYQGGIGKGNGDNPLVGKVLGLCLRLLEDAVDDPEKRSWDDVFGALAPVCEDILKMVGWIRTLFNLIKLKHNHPKDKKTTLKEVCYKSFKHV